jgi:hypothetical protein
LFGRLLRTQSWKKSKDFVNLFRGHNTSVTIGINIIVTAVAILLAPVIALRINVWLNKKTESENRKREIFRNLMATRGSGLSPIHVEALNKIDIEFSQSDEKTKSVFDAWKEYRDHLNDAISIKPEDKEAWKNWTSRKEDMLVELLYKMSIRLDYRFDRVHIKRGHYYPKGYVDIETEQRIIRQGLVNVFENNNPLPVLALVANAPPPSTDDKGGKSPDFLLSNGKS